MKPALGALILILGLYAAGFAAMPGPPAAETQPNIILLLADALRSDYLGCYGFQGDISPNIDRLAAESVLFERAVTAAPWTKPAIASLFTSLHPLTHRVLDPGGPMKEAETSALPDAAITLAEVLGRSGYTTVGWSGNHWITAKLGFEQGFERFRDPSGLLAHRFLTGGVGNVPEADLILEPAWRWLESYEEERPFFMYLHFMDTHGPWRWYPEEFALLEKSPSLGPDREIRDGAEAASLNRWTMEIDEPLDRRVSVWRAVYGSGVRAFDRRLGKFLERLRGSGRLANTLVVFTADHGEELGEHGRWGHGDALNSSQTRIPLLFRLPGREPAGRSVDTVASLIDIMPTLLSAARVADPPETMQGADLWGILQGDRKEVEETRWAVSSAIYSNPHMMSIENGKHKLIWDFPQGARRLFDIGADPEERKELGSSRPELLESLAAELTRRVSELKAAPTLLESTGTLTPEEIERLKSLGYIQ